MRIFFHKARRQANSEIIAREFLAGRRRIARAGLVAINPFVAADLPVAPRLPAPDTGHTM
jgi:hypothetical protein